ncbi:MAG: hypothetical protein HXY41_14885 [Chloroflexi bacterium]|nr:hypothetical protein [Chloroflexota bacterium]
MRIIACILLVVLMATGAAAQEALPLEFDTFVSGTLTNEVFEVTYSFKAESGQLVLIEMLPKPGTYDLDPALLLRDSSGKVLAVNDDFDFPTSLIAIKLPANDSYTVLATRSGGSTGSSTGDYVLRARLVQPLAAGQTVEATIFSDLETAVAERYVLMPEASGALEITFSQQPGELYASLELSDWVGENEFVKRLFDLSDTAGLSRATLAVEVEAGKLYILTVDKAPFSFVFGDEITATVKITVN